jgi:two-component system aerobic respiration control sensor histidine kinase ArcB
MATNQLDNLVQELSNQYQYISSEKYSKNLSFNKLIDNIINYYEDIISCMPGNVYWFDSHGAAVGCNKNVLQMFGFKSITEFRGLSFEQMGKIGNWTPEATTKFKNDTFEVLQTGKPKLNVEEPPIPHSNGSMIYFLSSRVPLFDRANNIVGMVGISIDVTERKQMEKALIAAKEAAEIASQAKTEFIANMSHDIRTPLSGMIGMAEAILKSSQEPLTKEHATDVVKASRQLLNLLNDILEVSRTDIKPQTKELETFNLKQLLDELTELLRPSFIKKNLQFIFTYSSDIPPLLKGNFVLIHRIFLNILGNAIKFTDVGYIELNVQQLNKGKDQVLIKINVIDTGIGISKNKLDSIFDPFTRLTPSYKGIYEGSGLGLHITKRFIELLDGTITVTSTPKKGSKFEIVLPLQYFKSRKKTSKSSRAKKDAINKQTGVSKDTKLNPPRVLIVEDDAIAGKVASITLKSLNCEVTLITTGIEALQKFKNQSYDLIYMDIGLPDQNGCDVIKSIRSIEDNIGKPHTPIVALSAHIDKSGKTHCLQCGANQVINKPVTQEIFRQHLEQFISQSSNKYPEKLRESTQSNTADNEVASDKAVIDWSLGESIVGSHALANKMLVMLKHEIQKELPLIYQSYETKQWDELQQAIHKFHGGVSFCGVPYLKTAARELELVLKPSQRKSNDIENSFKLFTTEIKRFLAAYERYQHTAKQ